MGSPGKGKDWHHIVEQSQIKKSGFKPNMIHNEANVVPVEHGVHMKISGYYSSKQLFTDGKIVRDWLAGKSFQEQFQFGIEVLEKFGIVP